MRPGHPRPGRHHTEWPDFPQSRTLEPQDSQYEREGRPRSATAAERAQYFSAVAQAPQKRADDLSRGPGIRTEGLTLEVYELRPVCAHRPRAPPFVFALWARCRGAAPVSAEQAAPDHPAVYQSSLENMVAVLNWSAPPQEWASAFFTPRHLVLTGFAHDLQGRLELADHRRRPGWVGREHPRTGLWGTLRPWL